MAEQLLPDRLKVGLLVGKFKVPHYLHLAIIDKALSNNDKVILIIGSVNRSRGSQNPFLFAERSKMIRLCLTSAQNARLHIVPLVDQYYDNDAWIASVKAIVQNALTAFTWETPGSTQTRVTLYFGGDKGYLDFYRKSFPDYSHDEYPRTPISKDVNSVSDILNLMFNTGLSTEVMDERLMAALPLPVFREVKSYMYSPAYEEHCAENKFIETYKRQFQRPDIETIETLLSTSGAGEVIDDLKSRKWYPPYFLTVDAVCFYNDRVLLINRKHLPGKGLLALPGGFVGQDETLLEACVRELKEETGFHFSQTTESAVPSAKFLVGNFVADMPNRSQRGRTVSHVFVFKIERRSEENIDYILSAMNIQAGDDAERANWYSIADLKDPKHYENMFEDHHDIILKALTYIA